MKSRKDLFSDSEIFKFTEYGWFDDDEQVKNPSGIGQLVVWL